MVFLGPNSINSVYGPSGLVIAPIMVLITILTKFHDPPSRPSGMQLSTDCFEVFTVPELLFRCLRL